MGFFSFVSSVGNSIVSAFNTATNATITAANAVASTAVSVANDAAKLASTAASEATKAAESVKSIANDVGDLAQKTTIVAEEAKDLANQSQKLAIEASNKAAEASRLASESIRLNSKVVANQAIAMANEARNAAYKARDLGNYALIKARDASIDAALAVKHGTETAFSTTMETLADFLIDIGLVSGCLPSEDAKNLVTQARQLVQGFDNAKNTYEAIKLSIAEYDEKYIVVQNEKMAMIETVKKALEKHKELTDMKRELDNFKLEGMAIGPIPDVENIGCIDKHRAKDIVEYVRPYTSSVDILSEDIKLVRAQSKIILDKYIGETKALALLRENYDRISKEIIALNESIAYVSARNTSLKNSYRIANKKDCCVKAQVLRPVFISDDGVVFDPEIGPNEYCGMYWGSSQACDVFYNNLCKDEKDPRCACLPQAPLPTDSDAVARIKNNMFCYNSNCNNMAYNQTSLDKKQVCDYVVIKQSDLPALEEIDVKNVFVSDEISRVFIFLIAVICALIYGAHFMENRANTKIR